MDTRTREQRHRIMAAVKSRHTGPEMMARRLLFAAGYRYRLHVAALPGRPDIVLPRHRAVIFVHGCFWHGHSCPKGRLPKSNCAFWQSKIDRNRERDAASRKALKKLGWRVLVVWQCEFRQDRVLGKMLRFLSPVTTHAHPRPADRHRSFCRGGRPQPRL